MDPKILREAALAYQAVYDEELRQEIEEQQDFENWVNSLVEEGYDLSEFTWEEMYEAYLSEIPINPAARGSTTRGAVTTYGANDPRRNQSGPHVSRFSRPAPATAIRTRSGTQSAPVSNLGRNYRGQELQATARANASQVRPTTSSRPAPAATTPAARPSGGSAAPAARPSAAARPSGGSSAPAARPAASAPTAKPAPSSTAAAPTAERRTPTSAELRSAQQARSTALASGKTKPEAEKAAVQAGIDRGTKLMGGPSGPGKIDTDSVSRDLARANSPSSSSTATPAAKPTPTPVKKPMGSSKPGSIVSGFDMFDVVKGYLIDEGFAETEQAAIAIMANMSEDWKLEIIDEAVKGEPSDRRRALAAERRKGIKPLPAKDGEKYATYKIGQMAYTKRAKMGDDD